MPPFFKTSNASRAFQKTKTMKTVILSLASLQGALARTPAVLVNFISNDGLSSFEASGRILELEHYEYEDEGFARITLDNRDRDVPDLRGYHVEIEYGDVIDGEPDTVPTPRLWVMRQKTVSKPGYLYTQLYLEDGWEDLGDMQALLPDNAGLPDFLKVYDRDTTIYNILAEILAVEGGLNQYTLLPIETSDGVIDVCQPAFEVKGGKEYRREAIKRLMTMTKCRLRMKMGLEVEIAYPQESDPAVVTYYSSMPPYFHELEWGVNECVPNTVYVYGEGVMGFAQDAESAARVGEKPARLNDTRIHSQEEADARAEVILSKAKNKTQTARLLVPHDCRIELWDKVEVGDGR
jgi:hypothetical protein